MWFHVQETDTDAKLSHQGPIGFAYYRRHPQNQFQLNYLYSL
jgi:hypothetical protein